MTFTSLAQLSNTKVTHQTQPAGNAPVLMVKNNAGGYAFELSPEKQLDRFLILGTSGGTYYQNERELFNQNHDVIKKLIQDKGEYVVNQVTKISASGRARKNDYALLVLALCFTHGSTETKNLARTALPFVARTGTHLLHFVHLVDNMRGWGSSLKKAVANWYTSKTPDQIAFQALKYAQRDGWSQRDVLRLSHPKAGDDQLRNNTYKFITRGYEAIPEGSKFPLIIAGAEMIKHETSAKNASKIISDYGLHLEMVPTELRNSPEIWEALLPHMGATAMLRNLNKMTSIGLISPFSEAFKFISNKLRDKEFIKRNRLHPLQILVGQRTYMKGRGDKGSLVWTPVPGITSSLEDAFYLSFDTVEPSGKNRFLALDVSGSMNSALSGASQITCREGAAVMAMVSARREPWTVIYGFDHQFRDLGITASDSLDTVCKKTYSPRFDRTDCAVPMMYALRQKWDVDQFEVYTDNETYYGSIHPFQAVQQYRNQMNKPDAKLAVVAMTASRFSIANPKDPNMMDLVGFDTATPALLSDFAAGRV